VSATAFIALGGRSYFFVVIIVIIFVGVLFLVLVLVLVLVVITSICIGSWIIAPLIWGILVWRRIQGPT
jgi:hypothetical protein